MAFSRWVTLVYSLLVGTCPSLAYAFGIYSEFLKASCHFTQQQLALVSTAGNAAVFFGLPAGLVYDKYGPRVTLSLGGCLALLGYSLLYMVVVVHPQQASVAMVAVLYSVACFSLPWYDTSNIITNVSNFPKQQAMAIGLCKSFSGLGASLFAQVFLGLFSPNAAPFLLAVPLIALAVAAGGVLLVSRLPQPVPEEPSPRWYFPFLLTLTALLAVCLLGSSLAQAMLDLPPWAPPSITAGMAAFLALYWVVPTHFHTYLVPPPTQSLETPSEDVDHMGGPDPSRECFPPSCTLTDAMHSPSLWLLFLVFSCGTGIGLMLTNNLAQLSVALAGPGHTDPTDRTVLVSLFAVGSALGRLASGILSQAASQVPRTAFLTATVALQGVAYLLLSFASHAALFSCVPLAGACYGAYWALMPTICTDLFGVEHLGAIYNFLQFSTSGGSLLFSMALAGRLYDQEAARQGHGATCYGAQCFRPAFLIATISCGVSLFGSLALQFLTRKSYQPLSPLDLSPSLDSAPDPP